MLFSGTMEVLKNGYERYELFHNIITEFKKEYNLTIINIQGDNKSLTYDFMRNDMEEDDIFYGTNNVVVTFSEVMEYIRVKLELNVDTFSSFAYKYQNLESIVNKHFKNKE